MPITITHKIDTMKEWEKWNKNPKYCEHRLGYWAKPDGQDVCITCGFVRLGPNNTKLVCPHCQADLNQQFLSADPNGIKCQECGKHL